MEKLNGYDYLIVIVYMVMMVGIGAYFARFMKDSAEYFKAGNRLAWWIGGLSSYMSAFSVWMFTGGAGKVYDEGLTGALWLGMTGLAIFTGYLLFAKLWRRSRVTTILEYLEERFNLPTHQIATWIYVPFTLLYCGAALFSLAIFLSAALRLSIEQVIWISGVVIVAYTLMGGLWAVCVTDVVQFLVLIPVCLLLIPLSLAAIGGPGNLLTEAPAGYWSVPSKGLPWYMIAIYLVLLIHGQNTNPTAQRYFSARDEGEAKKVSLLCTALFLAGIFFWAIPPMCARILYPSLSGLIDLKVPSEGAFVVIALRVLPHGLVGLLVAGMFAATMSSLDSVYNVVAAIVSKDVAQRVFDRSMSDRAVLRVGQVVTGVVGLLVIVLSLLMNAYGQGAFDVMMKLSVLTGTPLATPMLLGFIYRRAPSWAGAFSLACSGAVALTFAFYPALHAGLVVAGGEPLYYAVSGFTIVGVGVASFLLSPLLFRDSAAGRRRIAGFFQKLATPVDVEKEVPPATVDTRAVARLVGILGVLLGLLMLLCAFVPGTLRDRLINLVLAVGLIVPCFLLTYLSRRRRQPAAGDGTASG
jgi:SSS family transporter